KAVQKALAALPPKVDEEVLIDGKAHKPATPPALADKLIGMLHFGRSGTGLLHSLVDSHPEVSTLPSIYLRGFFNAGVWNKISADGWRKLPERFADEFAVLFDANSSKPTPGMIGEDSPFLGRKEGMTTVGEDRNESLSLDRDQFCSEALRLIEQYTTIHPGLFLLVVHAVFEKVLGTKTKKHTVFYHIHNPDDFSKLNFLRHAPDARLLMMVREPVQSCESWVRDLFNSNEYGKLSHRIISMLFAVDQVAFRMRDSVGVRLEDLKMKPEATLRSLCTWLGIKETPSLYQMTAQGKKWWGDPTSPDYDTNKAMDPFDRTSIQRSVGSIFSEQDQFVLGTLFYPFSVRFGYREPDPVAFEKDLKEIRPLLDELLDFEKMMSEKAQIDPDQFKRSGNCLLLHAGLMDRWDILNKFKDYPHLLSPLKITVD
ncbi:MAG: sulfotransferase, partial [SAR324 cluster bacterium]|nr:sulfotransferase [SAR324 cluster bacterium]